MNRISARHRFLKRTLVEQSENVIEFEAVEEISIKEESKPLSYDEPYINNQDIRKQEKGKATKVGDGI